MRGFDGRMHYTIPLNFARTVPAYSPGPGHQRARRIAQPPLLGDPQVRLRPLAASNAAWLIPALRLQTDALLVLLDLPHMLTMPFFR
ncbi:MAG: hypothetical protein ACK40Z_14985 [Dietzia sp.]